ncbi:MAG: peptidylprolyl isomerase [Gammaproteobacteria bacterium]
MSRWLQEPLLHFLMAGGLLFVAYGWLNPGKTDDARVVRITAAEINWLTETWSRQWQRPPDEEEFENLVNDYLKEVLLAREAHELGLDENDTVVRRRLAQKMEFLVQDTAALADPDEKELREFYHATRAQYRIPTRISLTQIYFRTEASARQGLKDLATQNPDDLGDPSLLERSYAELNAEAAADIFGRGFADNVFSLDIGKWRGPVESGYGFHLVRIEKRQAARQRPFEKVRTQVLAEWQRSRQARAAERYFAELLTKYEVVVEGNAARAVTWKAER